MKNPAKKILCTVMALLVVGTSGVVFTGCGSDNSKDSSSSKEKTTTKTTTEKTTAKQYAEMVWPSGGIADKLPIPKSTVGDIISDSEDYLDVTVGNTSLSDFQQYVNDCKAYGFTVDYDNLGDTFYAKNRSGYDLSVYYDEKDKSMDIILEEPDEEESTVATKLKATKPKATKKTTSQKSNSTSGVNADFKATMDSYEEFFNDYVDFMKKYKNSTDITSMASDYADYMTKYSDMMQKLNDIKSEDLSTADLAYYNEVNARITKKLAEVAN